MMVACSVGEAATRMEAMPVNAENCCLFVPLMYTWLGVAPLPNAVVRVDLTNASVKVRLVPAVAAETVPAEKPPADPPAPKLVLVVIHAGRPAHLRGVAPDS